MSKIKYMELLWMCDVIFLKVSQPSKMTLYEPEKIDHP